MKNPTNLDECFLILQKELSVKDINEIKNMSKKDLCKLHHNLGRWIRNNWKLWEDGSLTQYFNTLGLHHADDMSGLIIESFWNHLRQEPLDLERQIKEYQDFWKQARNQ